MESNVAKKKLLDLSLPSPDKMPDSEKDKKYLRENCWEKIYTESGKFLGWWHPTLSGLNQEYYQEYEAVHIQKKHDDSMKNDRFKTN